eukprot:1160648-Pelagomonas_calceolata.AAC.6
MEQLHMHVCEHTSGAVMATGCIWRSVSQECEEEPLHRHVEELRQQVRMLHAVSCNSVGEEEEAEGETRTPGVRRLCSRLGVNAR